MKKVYIVYHIDIDWGIGIEKVFVDRAKAEEYLKECKNKLSSLEFDLQEHEVYD